MYLHEKGFWVKPFQLLELMMHFENKMWQKKPHNLKKIIVKQCFGLWHNYFIFSHLKNSQEIFFFLHTALKILTSNPLKCTPNILPLNLKRKCFLGSKTFAFHHIASSWSENMRENISAVELAYSYEIHPFGKCNGLLGYAVFCSYVNLKLFGVQFSAASFCVQTGNT